MNLLIVDDTPISLKLLRAQLEAEGHAVFEARDGVDALALLERQPVDAVISDILMPRMDGYRLCYEIRKHARLHDLPIIIYTSTYTSPGDEKLVFDVGADKYLKKPVSVETLVAALDEVIAKPHAAPQPKALQEIEVLKEYSERLVFKLEEKNTELMASEAKFRALVEQSIVGIYIIQDDQLVYVNPRMAEILGRSEKEMTSRSIYDFAVPEDHALVRENIRKRISGGVPSLHYSLRMLHQSGAVLQVEVHGSRADYNGRLAVMGTLLDITERKRVEEARRRGEEQLAALIHSIDGIVWETDAETFRFTFVSPRAERLLGYPTARWTDEPGFWVDHIHPDDCKHALDYCLQCTREKRDHEFEYRMLAADGRVVWLRDIVTVVVENGRTMKLRGIMVDITESKQAAEALRTTKQQLRALVGRLHTAREDEAKRIARELHDDLGQQLTALNMELDNLEMKLPGALPQQRDQIARMHTIVDHTIQVVQKIAGELRLGQLDVLGLTAAIDWQLKEVSRRSAIPCRITLLDEVANLSDAQSTAIFRILQEALTNIVRHAGATEVEIGLQAGPDQLTLKVRDNGRGITAAEVNAQKAIGLLGMHERAQLVGGDVTITSGAGVGTTVLVTIPFNRTSAIPA